jgi:adrenodoxin-NADP+ reductase
MKKNPDVTVDIFERLPVPFGLVRFGVAPDHPEVKNVTDQFTQVAENPRCEFFGNVEVGKDVDLAELRESYNAVVLSYGNRDDRKFGLEGEDLNGVLPARAFVGWYNGLPEMRDLKPPLDSDTAVIFGQGNVALDVARMLLAPLEELSKTDITDHAVNALRNSKVKRVIIVGRRGSLNVAFTIKELRELSRLGGCRSIIQKEDVSFTEAESAFVKENRARKRLTELMQTIAASGDENQSRMDKEWELMFKRSPAAFLESDTEPGRVGAVRLQVNTLQGDVRVARAVGTEEFEEIQCGLVLNSIGYKGVQLCPGAPFDETRSVVPNDAGRVLGSPGLYCSGWIKTGPTGVILTTMNNAFETANSILADIRDHKLPTVAQGKSRDSLLDTLAAAKVELVKFDAWGRIDSAERARGQAVQKPREKITSVDEMLALTRA